MIKLVSKTARNHVKNNRMMSLKKVPMKETRSRIINTMLFVNQN